MNILVVDDHEENRYLLETLLRANGHDVQPVANGAEAIEKLDAQGFDLIVSDILMPVMDGFQLCRKVKADKTLGTIPFIIYTATYTGPQDEAFAMKIGADRFLQKPCEPDAFMAAVNDVMAATRSRGGPSAPAPAPEAEILKLYSERLVRKLEQKMLEMEREVRMRRAAEETLRRSEALLNATQRISHIGGWEWDVGRQEMFWTAETYRIHDLDPDEIRQGGMAHIERSVECYAQEDRPKILAAFQRCVDEGIGYELECRFTTAKGRRRWIRTSGQAVGHGDRVTKVVGNIQDITAHKRADEEREKLHEQLLQAQKMESVGRLAGGVAHDYNNMLSVIIGYTDLAMAKANPSDPLHKDLKEILNAARRATMITRQLLAFARQQTIAPQVLDLNETVEKMITMLRRLIGEDIDLAWRPGADLWPVKIDPSQVDQILANLCVNARDAITDVGKVTIETDRQTLDADYCADHPGFAPGDFVLLAVSDDGCGMDRHVLDKIFEPFFTTKAVGRGTGLGLATVYGIIKQNEGFINVYSEPDNGTTFRIYLPRHAGKVEPIRPESTAQIQPGRGETVLLVEDEVSILKLVKKILEELAYTVLDATTPGQALALAKEHAGAIDLLITDVVMPGMNGRDLADQLQFVRPDLKTLFMSGYTADVIAHRGVLDKGATFIQKPFSTKDLAVMVRSVLDGK